MAQTEGGGKYGPGKTKNLARTRLQASIVGQDTEAPPTKAIKTFKETSDKIYADAQVLLQNAAAKFHEEIEEAGGKAHIVVDTEAWFSTRVPPPRPDNALCQSAK